MPPSITPENLERSSTTESLQSVSSRSIGVGSTAKEGRHTTQRLDHTTRAGPTDPMASYHRSVAEDDDAQERYGGSLDLFERPSWTESFQRLKWCCPGIPGISKNAIEKRVRTRSESTSSGEGQLSPVAIAPAYHWDPNFPMPYHPAAPFAFYPPGYHPTAPYPNGYQAWGYPMPTHNGMPYAAPHPPPPPHLFHNKSMGYIPENNMPHNKNPAPEPYQPSHLEEDSGSESEVSRKGHIRQHSTSSRTNRRQASKPPLVQRRATAPVHSSPFASTHKESIDQPFPPLPPKQASRRNVSSARPRLPSEMSRTSVGTTSSRHRRQAHETFEFSTNSLREIAREGPVPPVGPPPLNFIEVQQSFTRTNSWSSWDDHTHNESDNSLLLSPDEEDIVGYISPVDEEVHSPSRPAFQVMPADWMLKWAQDTDQPPPSPASRTSRTSEPPVVPTKDTVGGPVYLPVSPALDKAATANGATLVFSGWVAMSEGDAMRHKLGMAEGKEVPIERKDICYLQLVHNHAQSQYNLLIHATASGETKTVPLSRSLQAQSQEISGRAGRCVILQDAWTRRVLWTILPVSLPDFFFRQDKVISERHFSLIQSSMFTPFYNATMGIPQEWSEEYCTMRYAPDEQHDAAMHILFSLDAALSSAPL